MTQSLADLAAALRAASVTVELVRRNLPRLERQGRDFGAGAPGRLGTTGEKLHRLWSEAIDARVAEASAMIDRLDETANAIVRAAAYYAEADAAAGPARAEER
jgi:hypothetical protein